MANTQAAIMAVPAPLDLIRLVGDEDKHATILYFGETSSLPVDAKEVLLETINQFVKTQQPFAARIVDVNRLGPEDPPALVAFLESECLVKAQQLMQLNPKVVEYRSNASQFPNYTPHVTLGYPDYQAEMPLRKMAASVRRIRFSQISLWWNDERFDFDLENMPVMDDEPMAAEAAWSSDILNDVLGAEGLLDSSLQHAYDAVKAHQYYEAHKHLKGRKGPTQKHRTTALAKDAKAGLSQEKRKAINEATARAHAALTKITDDFRTWVNAHPKASPAEKEAERVKSLAQKQKVVNAFRQTVSKISAPKKTAAAGKPKGVPNTVVHEDVLANFLAHVRAEDFTESMVKRDGRGKFSSKASDYSQLDAEWLASKTDLAKQLYDGADAELKQAYEDILDKYSVSSDSPKVQRDKALTELLNRDAKIMNEHAKASGVSPSGTKRLAFFVNNDKKKLYSKPVAYKGKPTPKPVSIKSQVSTNFPGLPKKKSGPMFNPSADISTGRVRDAGDMSDFANSLIGNLADLFADLHHAESTDDLETFLAHHGIKGMRWGFRKNDSGGGAPKLSETTAGASSASRAAARARVKAGTGTLKDAHIAGLKSSGRRATNALLGDKQYWKREAEIAGVVAGIAGLTALGAAVLPASALVAVAGAAGFGTTAGTGGFTSAGLALATAVGYGASTAAGVSNTVRAIRGNARIDKSYAKLGSRASARQTAGDKKTRSVLNKSGSIRKSKLKHADSTLTLGDVYNNMSASKKSAFDLIVGASLEDVNISGVASAATAYDDMDDNEINLLNFIVGSNLESFKHSDDAVDDFLAHFGVRGMRWGFRKTDSSSRGSRVVSKEEALAHNTITDRITKSIKSATNESQVEDLLDSANLNGLVEGHIKPGNIEVTANGKKIKYDFRAYRLTPGKPNTHSGDGIKVEHIIKEVHRLKPGFGRSHADDVEHMDSVDDFLAHFGIKGMRWGFRRERGSDGTVAGGVKEHESDSGGGHGGGTQLSDDALHLAVISGKKPHEMSTAEIKLANSRAEALKKYNEFFGPKPNQELQLKVERLELEKRYAKLYADAHPSLSSRVLKFAKAVSPVAKFVMTTTNPTIKKLSDSISKDLEGAWKDVVKAATTPPKPKAAKTPKAKKSKASKGAGYVKNASSAAKTATATAAANADHVFNITTLV